VTLSVCHVVAPPCSDHRGLQLQYVSSAPDCSIETCDRAMTQ
jgi:hypothetical protein